MLLGPSSWPAAGLQLRMCLRWAACALHAAGLHLYSFVCDLCWICALRRCAQRLSMSQPTCCTTAAAVAALCATGRGCKSVPYTMSPAAPALGVWSQLRSPTRHHPHHHTAGLAQQCSSAQRRHIHSRAVPQRCCATVTSKAPLRHSRLIAARGRPAARVVWCGWTMAARPTGAAIAEATLAPASACL